VRLKEVNIRVKNKMPNTEKPTTIAQQKKSGIVKSFTPKGIPPNMQDGKSVGKKQSVPKIPIDKSKVIEDKEQKIKTDEKDSTPKDAPSVKEDVNTKDKKPIQTKPKVKRDYAVVDAKSVPISAKHSIAICRFIKNKKIGKAIESLGEVLIKKRAIPMKGEIPHRKGKMMSGRYPQKAVGHFIKLLKSLESNASVNELNEPVITEAISNLAQRPYGRFGKTKKKRTHIKIVAKEKKILNKNNEEKK